MSNEIRHSIDRAVDNAIVQIEFDERESSMRRAFRPALWTLVLVPAAALLFQIGRYLDGVGAGFGFSWPWLTALTLIVPIAWLFFRTVGLKVDVDRQQLLGKLDRQLGSSERLVSADQFLHDDDDDVFKQAAIEDASQWAQQAQSQAIRARRETSANSRTPLLAIPVAGLILGLAWLVSRAELESPKSLAAKQTSAATSEDALSEQRPDRKKTEPKEEEEQPKPSDPEEPSNRAPEKKANRQGTAANTIPNDAQLSRGKLTDGETSESQQSSNPSSARGEPSSSGQPSTSEAESKPKEKKPQKKKKDEPEREKKERDDNEEPTGSTAGQGSSKGSNNNAAPSDWSSKSQMATPDDEEVEDEDDVEDEDEEQKSRGGVQPNMRDRRAPVNRDLQIGFGTNRPNPDANGRGGPGGQKKSRGVASLVLGVPIPDRVTGQPNKGRIRITQQRITPEAEQSESVAAEDRGQRTQPVGPIAHPELSPWLQRIVRDYFLGRRNRFPLRPNVQDQTTTSSAESSSPQS